MYFQKILLAAMWKVATGKSMELELWEWETFGGCHILCLLVTPEIILFHLSQSLSSLEWVWFKP